MHTLIVQQVYAYKLVPRYFVPIVVVALMPWPAAASSLLDDLLLNSHDLQTSLANAAENLGVLDGSISIAVLGHPENTRDQLAETLPAIFGVVDSTAIGVLGDNRIAADSSLSGLQTLDQAQTDSAMTLFISFDTDAPSLNKAINLSSNIGSILGSVTLSADGVAIQAEGVSTIAVGSLTSNIVQSSNDIQSQLVNNASALKDRLIGPPTTPET